MAFADHAAAKSAGWFSRKYRTNEVHSANSQANQDRLAAKFHSAFARQESARKLSDAQRLAKLPATGATKERAKLTARIAAAKTAPKVKTPDVKTKGK
jgi:hypothetical protein